MRSTSRSRLTAIGLITASLVLAACQVNDSRDQPPSSAVSTVDTSHVHIDSAGGDVAHDSLRVTVAGKWITDANALALLGTMSSRQIAAADAELDAWHTDTVRTFAASVAREHAEIQHSLDSLVARIHLAPVAPALAEPIAAAMQAQVDSIKPLHGAAMDHAFVHQQVVSEAMMADYLARLSVVAEQPDVQALLASASARVSALLARARGLQTKVAAADSLASVASADSAAKRAARRQR